MSFSGFAGLGLHRLGERGNPGVSPGRIFRPFLGVQKGARAGARNIPSRRNAKYPLPKNHVNSQFVYIPVTIYSKTFSKIQSAKG